MRISFHALSTFTAALCLALAIAWGVRPDLLLWLWGVEYTDASGLVARRNAMLFLAIGIMFYRLRHTAPSPTRSAPPRMPAASPAGRPSIWAVRSGVIPARSIRWPKAGRPLGPSVTDST